VQKTLSEGLDEFLGWVGEQGDPMARDVAERAITRSIERVWLKHPWRDYQSPDPLELTLVAGQRNYALSAFFGRLGLGKVRNITKGCELFPLDSAQADELYPARGTSLEAAGAPRHYLLGGIVGVQRQPAVTGEALEVLSSSAADNSDLRVSLVGADASGNERRVSLTLNGTTAVAAGTWSYVDEFGKGYRAGVVPTTEGTSSEGTVTLRIVSSATTLQQLFPEESAREHRILTVLPKPDAADVLTIPVMRRPPRLLYDGDPLPGDWWNAIFEDLCIQWRVNRGELDDVGSAPRPDLLDLICADNANKPRPVRRPFL
jgi:hypothetical protein